MIHVRRLESIPRLHYPGGGQGQVTRTFRRLDPPRQQAVIQAILDEAALRGPAALNIKQVAARAGVSVGSLYQYFGDRDRMLNFAVDLCVRFVGDAFDLYRPYLAAMPLREALAAYISGGIEWSRAEAGFLQLFARGSLSGRLRAGRAPGAADIPKTA